MEGDVLLEMNVSTEKMPPTNIKCISGNGVVECIITDIATKRQIASFKIKEDLKDQIPQLLHIYIR